MLPLIATRKEEIAELCRRHGVQRLELFGSAARPDLFSPIHSDIDLIVTYEPDHGVPSLERHFALRDALADLFGRPVDLIVAGSLRNPYIRATVEDSRETVFAA